MCKVGQRERERDCGRREKERVASYNLFQSIILTLIYSSLNFSNELSLESVLEIRRKSFLSNMRVMFKIQCEQTVVTINSIKQKLVEEYRYRRSELDKFISNNRNDPTTPMPTIASIRMYFPSYNNPLRELAFHLHVSEE